MTYHLLMDATAQWKWELRTNAGKLIAVSGTRYKSRENCLTSIRAVQRTSSAAVVDAVTEARHVLDDEMTPQ